MRDTVLLDLDGTLVPMDQDRFVREYFALLTREFHYLMPADRLITAVTESTNVMIANGDSSVTNMQVFVDDFRRRTGCDIGQAMSAFTAFYCGRFRDLARVIEGAPIAREIVDCLQSKGYSLVCATNAIFPREAVAARLAWVGLDLSDFILVTTYEDMHFCKPSLSYYHEVLDRIGRRPEECIMVGNDVQEDMVASEIGIETFLVEDHIIDRGLPGYFEPDHRGDYGALLSWVQGLPEVSRAPLRRSANE